MVVLYPSRLAVRNVLKIRWLPAVALAVCMFLGGPTFHSSGQETRNQASDGQRLIADRFLEVLLRRPRPGTALDRVYSYHVQNQSLDEFMASLDVAEAAEQSGARQMVLGLIHVRRGNSSRAVQALEKADAWLPDNVMASYHYAKALLTDGKRSEAQSVLQRAIRRGPSRTEAPDIYLDLGRLYLRSGQSEQALEVWQKLTDQFPVDQGIAEKVATSLADEQQLEAALQHFMRLAKDAKTAEYRIGYQVKAAELKARLGQTEIARNELVSILDRLRPGSWLHSDVRGRLERSFLSAGDVDGLTAFYTQQADRWPDDLTWLVRLGEILRGAGHDANAEQVFRKAIDRAPNDSNARLALSEILVGDGRAAEAADQFEQLLAADPTNPDYLMRLGEIRLSDLSMAIEDRQQAAADAWNRMAKSRAHDAVSLASIAKQMHTIDRTDRATELYRQAIQLAPAEPQYREYLGEYLHRLGRNEEAVQTWNSIASDDRHVPVNLIRLADIFASNDYPKRSLQAWRDAAKQDLSLEQQRRFARALSSAGEHDDALQQLDRAAELAQGDEESEQLMRDRILILQAADRLSEHIAEISIEKPTAENQRFLALLFQANGQTGAASLAINAAMKLDPDDVMILRDAVDIAENFGQLAYASQLLQSLAQKDQRFRINHLRRLVETREKLGDSELALAAAQEMIDANPTSPESYRLYARIAFSIGKNDDGDRMLRRAIIVAPRDIPSRITLATRLAERFQTGEAIELLWEAVEYENNLSARVDLVQKLVPLYARRGEIDQLVGRIERHDLNAFDDKSKQLLIASVWGSVQDHKQAQLALNRSLAKQPRDPDLLQAMVDSLLESDEERSAVDFQRRLVNVDDTPANQSRLASLELQAGLITPLEAKTREIKATDDVRRMALIALRDADKDPEQSARLCEVVLEKNPELWDVKIIRAQLLLQSDAPQSEERAEHLAQAQRLASEVAQLDLHHDDASPAVAGQTPTTTRQSTQSNFGVFYQINGSGAQTQLTVRRSVALPAGTAVSAGQVLGTIRVVPSGGALNRDLFPQTTAHTLKTILRLNDRRVTSRQISGQKSFSFSFGSNVVLPIDFFQAKWIARSVQILSAVETAKLNDTPLTYSQADTPLTYSQAVEKLFPPPSIDSEDVDALRTAVMMHLVKETLQETVVPPREELVWRIAELDPAGDHPNLASLLAQRSSLRRETATVKLDDRRLEILKRLCVKHQELAATQPRDVNEILADTQFRQSLIAEYRLAGKSHPFGPDNSELPPTSGFNAAITEIEAALFEKNIAHADTLTGRLVDAARATNIADAHLTQGTRWMTSPKTGNQVEFVARHRENLIDAWIAFCSRRMVLSQGNFSPAELFEGERIQIVSPVPDPKASKLRYQIFTLHRPFSDRLFDAELMRGLITLLPRPIAPGPSGRTKLLVDDLIEQLHRPLTHAPLHEEKLRRVIAAFACWWDDRPYDCYVQLTELADAYPDDLDLQIEAARLAVVTLRSTKAFERLDGVQPLDDQTQTQLQIARIILSADAGKDEMVRRTARELLAGTVDPATREFVAQKLQSIAKPSSTIQSVRQAFSSQPRLSTRSRAIVSDDTNHLALAKSMLQGGDTVTASEIAYSILIRRQNANQLDRSSVRRQAIDILARTGRLQPLITTTERKFKSSPDSDSYRQELADLYVAAGQPEKASQLWEQVINALKLSPRQIITRASTLRGRRDFHHAAMLYVYAFQRDPTLWASQWNVFAGSVAMSTSQDIIFDELCKLDVSSFTPYSLCELIRIRRANPFGPAQRKFTRHVIGTHPQAADHLDLFFGAVPESERIHIPELTAKLTDAITSDDAYQTDAPLWIVRGWSDDGQVSGLLTDAMDLLRRDPDVAQRFLAAVATEQNQTQPTGHLLKAVYQLHDPKTRSDAARAIGKLCPATFADSNSPPIGPMPAGLLWQIGQSLDSFDQIDQPAMLKIGVYQAAIRNSTDQMQSSFGVGLPSDWLLREYAKVGRKQLARRGWLARLRQDKTPRTTGVRENRQLQIASYVSDNLLNLGYPVDAAGICRRYLDQPILFQLARRYFQGRDPQKAMQATFKTAIDAIDANAAEDYLNALATDVVIGGNPISIDLYTTRIANVSDTPSDCLFELAAGIACDGQSGRETANKLFELLDQLAKQEPANASLQQARLILAAALYPERVAPLLDSVRDHLASPENAQSSTRMLYFAMAATCRGRGEIGEAGIEPVLQRLQQIAESCGDDEVKLALIRLSRRPAAMLAVLESIANAADREPPSRTDSDRCLSIARSAATMGHWDVVARALEVALGAGPTMDSGPDITTTEVSDEFGGEAATRYVSPIEDPLAEIREQVLAVLDHCKDQNGIPVSDPDFDPSQVDLSPDTLGPLDRALRQVIFPSERYVNVYAYSRPVFVGESVSEGSALLPRSQSVAYAAGNLARLCDSTDSLSQKIRARSNAANYTEGAALFVDLAVTTGDTELLAEAIEAFTIAFDSQLPWLDGTAFDDTPLDENATTVSPGTSNATNAILKKPIPPRGVQAVSSLADQVVRTLSPVLQLKNLDPSIQQKAKQLLLRTTQMMRDNETVKSQFERTIDRIESLCK